MIEGRGHNVPETGDPYNERLERFLGEPGVHSDRCAGRDTLGSAPW